MSALREDRGVRSPARRVTIGCGLATLLVVALVAGCSRYKTDFPRTPSSAFREPQTTTLGRLVELVGALTRRGVRVRVLTNSMASNDVAAVYSGYRKYRDDLLREGADIYELRPDSAMRSRWSVLSTGSRSGLHTKAMVVDREHTVIGSYNLDPRSADINSEVALLVDSPEFGRRVAEYLDEGVQPQYSYRVILEDGDPVWTTETDGKVEVHTTAPDTTWWQRFKVGLIGLLPIQSQL